VKTAAVIVRTRRGSVIASIPAIMPSAMVKLITANGSPSLVTTTPAAPFIRTGRSPAACPAGQLFGRGRGPAQQGADLPERQAEQVMQDERQPFVRGQGVEDDQEGKAD
jgi:hypothetical protein